MSSFRASSIQKRISFHWEKAKSSISNSCTDIWYNKHGIDKFVLKEWEWKIVKEIYNNKKSNNNRNTVK